MEGRGGEDHQHPWQDDVFLFEQMDYIIARLKASVDIYEHITKPQTQHRDTKLEKLKSLRDECVRVDSGMVKEYDTFMNKFTRILKLLTDAYSDAIGYNENDLQESTKSSSPQTNRASLKTSGLRLSSSSSSLSSSRSLRKSMQRSSSNLDTADMINSDPHKHHYARLLGLMLADIYRLMNDDILPSIKEAEKQKLYYKTAIRIQFPNSTASEEDANINAVYAKLKLRTPAPLPDNLHGSGKRPK